MSAVASSTAKICLLVAHAFQPPQIAVNPDPPIEPRVTNDWLGGLGETGRKLDDPVPVNTASNPDSARNLSASIAGKPKVSGAAPKADVKVRTEACNPNNADCASTRAGCITESGNPNYFAPPTIVYVSVNGGPWTQSGMYCGVPSSVTVPGAGPGGQPGTVTVQAPPVPTFAEIQEAYKRLPFSKPKVAIQPVGLKTLINLPTYYQASWPDDSGLQPGEVSEPVQLLSWTVEFKITAKDYRYNFGDGSSSGWTMSEGGVYPTGDVTHVYKKLGTVDVSVDARLTGQYRVNGGEWQDIATVADLQDEPVSQLQVLGTKTRLTSTDG